MNYIFHRYWETITTMALYNYHTPEYRDDLFSLYEHAKRVSDRNDVHIEMIFEDLIHRNLTNY